MKRRASPLEVAFDRIDQMLGAAACALAGGAGYAFYMGWP